MRVVFVCDVVPLGSGPGNGNAVGPAVELVRNATGGFPCSWAISSNPPIAGGVCEVTADQLSALQADSRIIALEVADLATLLSQLPKPRRTAIKNKLTQLGVTALDTESLQAVFDRASTRANGEVATGLDDLHSRLRREWGLT